jgi:hypothetical protein
MQQPLKQAELFTETGAGIVSLLGVEYPHLKTSGGGDLYLTEFGRAIWQNLLPENWYAPEWFEAKRERLEGTSTVYRVPTRCVNQTTVHLVVKWSRVGEVVPLDTLTFNKFMHAEFNSPFEEFALLMELRRGQAGPAGIRIRTQRPLGIFVPTERLQLWQTGRSEEKIRTKVIRHPGVEIDILRRYVVLYGWIDGLDAVKIADQSTLTGTRRTEFLARTTSLVTHELEQKGYRVIDMKPAHVILRLADNGRLLRENNGQLAYALVDYELLERTPEHEQAVRSANRQIYLKRTARRFEIKEHQALPAHLRAASVLGVDYIFGHAESTGGLLWVVGHDPDLFNYFLPERWRRTPHRRLSSRNAVFKTCSKDNINLVWKVSRMGDRPWLSHPSADPGAARAYGFNSPFEEFAFALQLARGGVKTVYPRAIYMTGNQATPFRVSPEERRYSQLANLLTPEGERAIRRDCDYITIWGNWNGPDELLASYDGAYFSTRNARHACASKIISPEALKSLMLQHVRKLQRCGLEDLNPKPDHLLLCFDSRDNLVIDESGLPEVRLCNFELVRPLQRDAEQNQLRTLDLPGEASPA